MNMHKEMKLNIARTAKVHRNFAFSVSLYLYLCVYNICNMSGWNTANCIIPLRVKHC